MSAKSRYPKDKYRNPSSKFILVLAAVSIVLVLIVGQRYLLAPSTADFNSEIAKESSTGSNPSEKKIQPEIEFTFFDTLTKPGKYTTSGKKKKPAPAVTLDKKEEKKPELKSVEPEKIIKPKVTNQPVEKPKFFIQMGSFKDISRAETFIAMLNKKGYQTTIESAEILNKGVWHRIFLKEGFADRKSALDLIKEIERKDKISALMKMSRK